MNTSHFKFREKSWLKVNLQFLPVGIAVGLVISLITVAFTKRGVSQAAFIYNLVFSIMITLSITNIVAFFQCYADRLNNRFWIFVIGFYVCCLAGMWVGTELTYVIVNLIENGRLIFALHAFEYKTNSTIVLIVGTLVLLYTMQKNNGRAELQARENDLIRTRQLQSEAELQALQSRINPHFLYNALNSVASLIHEDPDKAEEMTIKLSRLFRFSINSARQNLHPLKDEIEILKTYIDIEQVRFGERMRFIIEVPESLDSSMVPRFLIQPLVENAIKHGLKNSVRDAEIRITAERAGGQLVISIFDNGIPFPDQLETGYGLQSTYDKLKLLYGEHQDLQLVNSPKHIKITIPAAA